MPQLHEGIGPFDDLSQEQFNAVIARIYSDNVGDTFETSGTSPTCECGCEEYVTFTKGKPNRFIAGHQFRVTHCKKNGHPRIAENVYINKDGSWGTCRLCNLRPPRVKTKATHCLRGHQRTPDNLQPNGTCKLCAKERLALPEVKAKAAAYRAAHPVPRKPVVTKTCTGCYSSFETNRSAQYCSKKCGHRAYKRRINKIVKTTKTCERCGDSFETTRSLQKFCAKTCKKAVHHKRQLQNNPVKIKALRKAAKKRLEKKIKAAVLSHYGNQCSWPNCIETTSLHLHHVLIDGDRHREQVGAAAQFYRSVKRNGFPDTLALLCPVHHRRHHHQVRQLVKANAGVPKALLSWVLTLYRERIRGQISVPMIPALPVDWRIETEQETA